MMTLFVQLKRVIKKLYNKYLNAYWHKVTYILVNTKAGILYRMKRIIQKHNLLILYMIMVQLSEVKARSEEHTSELQSRFDLVCRLLLETKNMKIRKQRDI